MKSVSFKKSVCIVLSTLITLAFLLSNAAGILPGHNIVRAAGDGHSHIGALDKSEDDHNGWEAWVSETSLPDRGGKFYLTKNVEITRTWNVVGETYLCLNGHSITAMGDFNAINIENSGIVLNLYDESGNGGTITHDNGKNGCGVYVNGGTFAMFGGTITGNKADYGGGVNVNRGTFDMSGGTISGNTGSYEGGGVYVNYYGTFTMESGTISGNTANYYGGGVEVDSGTFTMEKGTITGNEADNGGGVYVCYSGRFTMFGGTISGNTAADEGGGVFVDDGIFTMSGGTISGNEAVDDGGGVVVYDDGTFTMENGTISGNEAVDDGGGVFVDDGIFTMENGTISENTAKFYGGGVYVNADGTFTMENGTISGNEATDDGGGVYVYKGTFTMSDGTISGNEAKYGGGVDVDYYGIFYMSGGAISGNTAGNGGGVFVNYYGTFTMSGGAISGNTSQKGGGVFITQGTFKMSSGTISENTAKEYGGGVDVDYYGIFYMSGGTISGNTANEDGGGVNVYFGEFSMESGTISENTSQKGGGVFITQGTFKMSSGTISENTAQKGGGVFITEGTFKMHGGIISENTANYGGGVFIDSNDKTHFIVSGSPVISENINVDGNANNIFLLQGKNIEFGSALTPYDSANNTGALIGVTTEEVPTVDKTVVFTSGLNGDLTNFVSDNDFYSVVASSTGTEAALVRSRCKITFMPNGGSGTMDPQIVSANVSTALTSNAFTLSNYDFTGWNTKADGSGDPYSDKQAVTLKEDITLYAQWTITKHTIKFVNDDGTVISSEKYDYGTAAADIVKPVDPTKAPTAQNTYTFEGWSPDVADVTGDATYTATYSSSINEYTIKFLDDTGKELSSAKYDYGTKAADIVIPDTDKAATAQYTYEFKNWDKVITDVIADATYTAVYTTTVNKYTVKFVNEDGTVLQSSEVAYGETPSYTGKTPVKADTEDYTYIFSGWSPEISKVTGDSTYKAVFTEKQKVGTYYLKNIEGDGKGGDIIATFGRTENDENAINYLDKVKADGKVLTRDKDYTAKKGSVIITIKKAYLDTLSEGTHTLEVCFTDGASVTLDFTVKHQAKYHVGTNTNANAATSTNTNTKAQASVPATGEKVAKTVFIGAGCVILACALAGGIFAMKMKRKEAQ